jgi:heterotetrameric sarcosine oxidase gamma subunit
MADSAPDFAAALAGRQLPDLSVQLDETVAVLTLRYFTAGGAFAAALRAALGTGLPATQAAVSAAGVLLAWRSPTETLAVGTDASTLAQRLADSADGCCVDLTGGMKVLRVAGARSAEFLCRLGGTGVVPRAGESRRGRVCEVPVQLIGVPGPADAQASETLFVVERVYAPHVLGWIRETLADLD